MRLNFEEDSSRTSNLILTTPMTTMRGAHGGDRGGGGGGASNASVRTNDTLLLPFQDWTLDEYSMPDMPAWIPVSYLVLLCVAVGVGIPGNLITAAAYVTVKVKKNCDWYIFFVAVFDLISCTFRVTGYLFEFMGVWAGLTNDGYCVFVSWISQTSVGMSIFIVGLIAIDRCIKVSFNSRLAITPSQSRNICLIFTVLAFCMGLPTLFIYGNTPRGICIVKRSCVTKPWVRYYFSTIFLLLFATMVTVIICYLKIAWTVMKNRRLIRIMPIMSTNKRATPRLTGYHRRSRPTQQNEFIEERDNNHDNDDDGVAAAASSPHDHQQQQQQQHHEYHYHYHEPQPQQQQQQQQQQQEQRQQQQQLQQRRDRNIICHGGGSCINKMLTIQAGPPPSTTTTTVADSLSIPQAPKIYVIPGPQTKALIIPQPAIIRNIKSTGTAKATSTQIPPSDATTTSAGNNDPHTAANNYVSHVEQTEISLEKATEMKTRNSDEYLRNKIRFSKEQWNKRLVRDYKVTGLLCLVTSMFIISWIMPTYASFRAFFVGIRFPFTVEDAAFLLYAPNIYIINNFINPVIYLALSTTYRKKVKEFFKLCANFVSRFRA